MFALKRRFSTDYLLTCNVDSKNETIVPPSNMLHVRAIEVPRSSPDLAKQANMSRNDAAH
jgi:hypothetical protein